MIQKGGQGLSIPRLVISSCVEFVAVPVTCADIQVTSIMGCLQEAYSWFVPLRARDSRALAVGPCPMSVKQPRCLGIRQSVH